MTEVMERYKPEMVTAHDGVLYIRFVPDDAGAWVMHHQATALQARVAELEGALKDAAASVEEWGAYASQYLQDKWDLSGEVARYIAVAEGKNDAALTGGKDE